MHKLTLFLLFCLLGLAVKAQKPDTAAVFSSQPYGKVDIADLKLTTCDFEKDANAMVLFDKTNVNTGLSSTAVLRHVRIKILTTKGTDQANVTISYVSRHGVESVGDVEAETVNLDDGKITYLKVDKSQFFKQVADKNIKKITFTFPQVKVGSVIEYTYTLTLDNEGIFPAWDIQQDIPVKYCELNAAVRNEYSYKIIPHVLGVYEKKTHEPWIKGKRDTIGIKYAWALKNIPSFTDEPYATSRQDNLQRIRFILSSGRFSPNSNHPRLWMNWDYLRYTIMNDRDFAMELTQKLHDADNIIAGAKAFTTDEEKTSYIFNKIKSDIKWNGENVWFTREGIKKAWDKKQGNSAEVNLILYRFLKQAGIKCSPLFVSTRDNGKINTSYPDINAFNKIVVSVTLSRKNYVLDACSKFNTWTDAPFEILNTTGFFIDPDNTGVNLLVPLKNDNPSRKVVFVEATIKPNGKLEGNTQVNRFSYARKNSLEKYEKLGEKKYVDALRDDDNNLKITSYKRENVEKDSLPLIERFDFQLDLTSSDDNYIFINPNLFTSFRTNPFLSEGRNSAIDFGSLNYYAINGVYKIPAGYITESLPKATSLMMPDTSITFKRIVAEQEGLITVRYTINYRRAVFPADEYPGIRDFYKKMFDLLNEQIVLKKE
ncbi:DUF3857 domain-containing protein [Mucilaginibacter flavidus]|uniref:DUF3857 domain-containing protein n=1 Tax=Mucilaginibacter flavidus TaxID=2949309 RepID=UPI00209308B5|nr:DUF3857 domain-containing protein [Mucilaginibacter flavidus]MCO5950598.1 DUF3857 domain-containing protein [Mucilaginibacter flavidus]